MYVQECWPQIHVNAESILQMVMRLLYDVTDQESDLAPQVNLQDLCTDHDFLGK